MKFNNKDNEHAKLSDGREVWLSRSVAVVSLVLANDLDMGWHVLAVHRHPKSTFPNTWCLPCGFLDWDETGGEAAIRETWEEAGLNLHQLRESSENQGGVLYSGIFENKPWDTSTTPDISDNQNVVFHFGSSFAVDSLPELSLDNTEPDELQDVKWMTLEEAHQTQMAFGHNARIKQFEQWLGSALRLK